MSNVTNFSWKRDWDVFMIEVRIEVRIEVGIEVGIEVVIKVVIKVMVEVGVESERRGSFSSWHF